MSELVDVGDIITTSNWAGSTAFLITRVTKTLAMSRRASDGYEHRFKRVISRDMSHPHHQYNTTKYEVIKANSVIEDKK